MVILVGEGTGIGAGGRMHLVKHISHGILALFGNAFCLVTKTATFGKRPRGEGDCPDGGKGESCHFHDNGEQGGLFLIEHVLSPFQCGW